MLILTDLKNSEEIKSLKSPKRTGFSGGKSVLGSKTDLGVSTPESPAWQLHHFASLAEYMKIFMYNYQQAEATAHENRSGRLFMVLACVPRVGGVC